MGKYERITPWEVFGVLVSCNLDFMNPIGGVINLVNIASLLNTNRYQVKKNMDYLVRIGVAEKTVVMIPSEYEPYPPYHGYCLTKTVKYKGRDQIPEGLDVGTIWKYRAAYQKKAAKERELIKKCFGN